MAKTIAHLNIYTYSISTSIKCMLSVADFLSYTKAFEFFLLAKHDALIGCLVYTYLFSFSVCTRDKYTYIWKKKVSTFPPIKPWNCQLVFTTRFMYNLSGNQQLLLMWGYVFLHPGNDIFITLIYKSILWTTQVEGHTQVQWPVTCHEKMTNSGFFLTSIFFLIYINDILFFLGKWLLN